MKICKLLVHKDNEKNHKNQEILLCPKDFPDVKAGDVVELYHPDDEWNRLLLQVKCLPEDFQQREAVSVEQSIALAFSLKTYNKICVNKVAQKSVSLDLVEVMFKEQYFGRSDMWRMSKTLTNTCVYLKKAIEFAGMRATVHELWSGGENVTSGLITESTRVVFRSQTAVVQIFLQISTEMWDFDLHGDLYFEKAVNGFLTDLFARWKDQNCLHDVTIVMFSRTFYEAQSFDEFPPTVRECLQMDCKGRIYEDFYRVIIQNERYEEWFEVLRELRTIFNSYEEILKFHHDKHIPAGWKMPKGQISVASQGNFLETLNMSLNLFEKYYLDRNFDRTGKVSVVITPGPGVFEVDRQLANITKQRTIDCGVGSDLVCMGEQPLHAAPLFKFNSKSTHHSIEVGDDYNIPHWMNHSFYMSKNQIENVMNSAFVPRIKPPPALLKELEERPKTEKKSFLPNKDDSETNIPFVDYDEYDAQVFKLPSGTMPRSFSARASGLRTGTAGGLRGPGLPRTFAEAKNKRIPRTRHISDDVTHAYIASDHRKNRNTSAAIIIPSQELSQDDMSVSVGCYPILEKAMSRDSFGSSESDELINQRNVVGSAGSPASHSRSLHNYRPRRALINPFAPSRLQFRMTSNRRRWVHAFPVDKSGKAMQARHVHSVEHSGHENDFPWSVKESTVRSPLVTVEIKKHNRNLFDHDPDNDLVSHGGESISGSPVSRVDHSATNIKRSLFEGQARQKHHLKRLGRNGNKMARIFGSVKSESEQDWSPDMNTAVDWKSLTIPASLPLTTDYFPDRHSLQYDYVVASYQFDVAEEGWVSWAKPASADEKTLSVYHRPPLTTQQVFLELISQRLGQGFQLITKNSGKQSEPEAPKLSQNVTGLFGRVSIKNEPDNECYMNIGRIYHKLTSIGRSINVTCWRPSHPTPQLTYEYRYRFLAPDSYTYDVSWTNFSNERLENYNWNHLDQYICTQGDYWECGLIDSLKYWRARFFLLPLNNPATKKIIDKESTRCDIYEERSLADCKQLTHGFIKFLENINKTRRLVNQSKDKEKEKMDEHLTIVTPSVKILEALMEPQHGMCLIQNQAGLPANTFVSSDAVAWCRKHVVGVDNNTMAVSLLQRLMDDQLILHCSGNPQHRFIYGFYLYYVPPRTINKPVFPLSLFSSTPPSPTSSNSPSSNSLSSLSSFVLNTFVDSSTVPSSQASSQHPTTHLVTPGANCNLLFANEWCEVTVLPLQEEEQQHREAEDNDNHTIDAEDETTPKAGSPRGSPTPAQQQEQSQPSFSLSAVRGAAVSRKLYGDSPGSRKRSDSVLTPEADDWRIVTGFIEDESGQPPATLLHKYTNIEVDHAKRSDRREFAIARYHAYYSPGCAFEIQARWMVATGCILGDLVYSYARRASLCGFHLLPVPCDPFALPYNNMSDPLRGPTFVPLNMDGFPHDLFDGYSDERKQQLLYSIQDAIIKRFGFMPCSVKVPERCSTSKSTIDESQNQLFTKVGSYGHCSSQSSNFDEEIEENTNRQYVHCTAGMFILIPESCFKPFQHSTTEDQTQSILLKPPRSSSTATRVVSSVSTSPYSMAPPRASNVGLGSFGGSSLETGAGSLPNAPHLDCYSRSSGSNTTTTFALDSETSRSQTPNLSGPSVSTEESQLDPVEICKRTPAELHRLYVARQGRNGRSEQVGFLWTWNFMSSKRWRSSYTGDEAFQDLMLADFRKFCNNDENRLQAFWESLKWEMGF